MPRLFCSVVTGGGLVLAACTQALWAQDVSVTPLTWANDRFAGDELPIVKRQLEPEIPEELNNSPEFGYVILELYADEKGAVVSHGRFYTLAAYDRVVTEAFGQLSLKPGRRAGQPEDTLTRCVVIFNPKSASRTKPDATPRLLGAALVADPSRVPHKGERAPNPETVWAVVSLDPSGRAVAVKDTSAELAPLIMESLAHWKFAPARRNGIPVAAEVRVPFVVVPAYRLVAGTNTPPRVISQVSPVYPLSLRTSGLRGDVVVNLIIDSHGDVKKADVVRSLNPAFDQPALDAVSEWKFEPGRRDGVPTTMRMQATLRFSHEGLSQGGSSGFRVEDKGDQSKLPPEFRYDVAPKPRGTMRPVYPYELLRDDIRGKARVRFALGVNGKVIFAAVVSADRPEFGAALQASIEGFEFEPALKDGRPTQALLNLEQSFSTFDREGVVTREDRKLLTLELKHPERISTPAGLDEKIRATSTRAPAFPVSLYGKATKGQALVEFLVDEEGHVRLPRVVSASDPAFGWSAVQAMSFWRFAPPRRGGKEQIVRARIPFEFNGPLVEEKK